MTRQWVPKVWNAWLSAFFAHPSLIWRSPGPTSRKVVNLKILCVTDDLSIHRMLDKAPRAEGYDVIAATNDEEGIELAESQDPDLILLDIGLSGINGIETLSRIRKANPEASAIVITAMGTIKSAVAAMQDWRPKLHSETFQYRRTPAPDRRDARNAAPQA